MRAGGQVFERALQGGVEFDASEAANFVKHVAAENLLQPCEEGVVTLASELRNALMGFEKCLLHHAGDIELAGEARIEIESGLETEEGPEAFEARGIDDGDQAAPLALSREPENKLRGFIIRDAEPVASDCAGQDSVA